MVAKNTFTKDNIKQIRRLSFYKYFGKTEQHDKYAKKLKILEIPLPIYKSKMSK